MTDESKDEREGKGDEDGRVVYARTPSAAEAEEARRGQEGVAAGLARLGRERVAPTLPVLLLSFVMLVALVFGLGSMSVGELDRLSEDTRRLQVDQSRRVLSLLTLRKAMTDLDFEARERATRELQGGIRNPFEHKLDKARGAAREELEAFARNHEWQGAEGRALASAGRDFIETTREADAYSTQGFEKFHDLERRIARLDAEARGGQQEIEAQRLRLSDAARRRIDRLRNIALLLALLVAGATTWEVQRRFRQMRRSLEESRRERAFSAQMLEGMVAAVAAIDGRDRIRSANRAFFRLFPRASVNSSVHDEIAPPEALRLFATATAARVESAFYHGRWELTAEGGGPARSFEVYSSPLHIDDGHGQIITLFDVSEAARVEAELRRKDALAAVGQAAAQVAHEIKNPLGSIRLGVAMLRDMTADAEAHSTIDLVERGIEHLNKLTVDVTQYSREKPLALEQTDLNDLLESSLELVSDKLREKRTPVERDYAAVPLSGMLDADQLRQVFVNLIANAVDASPEGAPVRVTTARTERRAAGGAVGSNGGGAATAPPTPHARVTVADGGAGMDAATRERVFEPFFTTKKRGTGLGLAIVKKIVEQHGGTINVESAPGQGARFHVELPLREGEFGN